MGTEAWAVVWELILGAPPTPTQLIAREVQPWRMGSERSQRLEQKGFRGLESRLAACVLGGSWAPGP